ncbi:Chloroplast envelope quinone oxidoreductase homolog [Linum perenne]
MAPGSSSKLMHAVQYDGYGGGAAALKHVEVPIPKPAKDEVLLKLEATSINPANWKVQKGLLRPLLPRKFPQVPFMVILLGADVAGEIVEVGSGVKKFKSGDKVVAYLGIFNEGGMAAYAIAKEASTVARPPEVTAAEGASLPVAGVTAYQALTRVAGLTLDGTGPPMNILVTAASGGVGHYAVQLAKLGKAHVTATCGARNIEFVRSLGADEVLDYKTPDGAALKSPSGKKYDAVVQCANGIPWSVFEPQLSENGKVIDLTPGMSSFVTFALKKLTFSKKQLVPFVADVNGESLECVVNLVKEKKLKTVFDSRFSLTRAEEGWAKGIEGHATGKIIIEP